ncbi:leucine carboxyl methyltransferase 1 [Mrakia frigida]|uniref:class I SAM-dependent methyltransferase n=1 Tax=Mrakia frigida TaxID=29902 RepID=UPI003FCC187D
MSFPQRFSAPSSSSFPSSSSSPPPTPDEAIRSTDSDAALSRLSAVSASYLSDPFASLFIRGRPPRESYRRPPLINIGTHARTLGVDELVKKFLRGPGKEGGQIVSLGAGSDTRFWRLMSDPELKDSVKKYVELDFDEITSRKAAFIKKSKVLSDVLGPSVTIEKSGTQLRSPIYSLLPQDLRNPLPADLIEPSLPTLWIAECLLVYLDPEISEGLVKWFEEKCDAWVGGIVYEMTGLNDSFGKVLISNLSSRQISLPSASLYPDLSSQPLRFSRNGYSSGSGVSNINQIRSETISTEEKERTSKLEMLDEIEEMELLFAHYFISWGWRASRGQGSSSESTEDSWGL